MSSGPAEALTHGQREIVADTDRHLTELLAEFEVERFRIEEGGEASVAVLASVARKIRGALSHIRELRGNDQGEPTAGGDS